MGTKSFSPISTQQSERTINRIQNRFDGGMFADLPKSTIPDNGVAYLKNFVNRGDRLTGRTGSKLWGDWSSQTAHAELPTITSFTVTIENNGGYLRVYNTTGYEFSADNVNDFLIITKDGVKYHYRILNVNSTLEVTTDNNTLLPEGTDIEGTQTVSLRGKINGTYYHKSLNKIILHIGTKLYIADDIYISGWGEIYGESYESLSDDISSFVELENKLYIACNNGIFTVDISNHPNEELFYRKINSKNPELPTQSIYDESYLYRYTYTLSKFPSGQAFNTRSNGNLLSESGSCYLNENSIDYIITGKLSEPIGGGSEQDPTIEGCNIPLLTDSKREKHWTHISLYRTLDIADNGIDPFTDAENNPALFIWVHDAPLFKIVKGNIVDGVVTLHAGYENFTQYDEFSKVYNPTYSPSATRYVTLTSGNTFELTLASPGETSNDEIFVIGTDRYAEFTCTGNILTKTAGTDFTEDDVGKILFVSDGSFIHVMSYVDGNTVGIAESITITTPTLCCWEKTVAGVDRGTTRNIYDSTTDDTLRPRISTYPLYQRFYENLPNVDIIKLTGGFLFGAIRNDNTLYYSQIPDGFEYLVGYYHPYYQTNKFNDNIRGLGVFPNSLTIYCANSTHIVPTNTLSTVELPDVGNLIAIITGVIQADANIGVLDAGSIQDVEIGRQIVITNEPGIRIFDGNVYSNNIASERISNILKSMQAGFSSVYVPYMGYIFWGNDE